MSRIAYKKIYEKNVQPCLIQEGKGGSKEKGKRMREEKTRNRTEWWGDGVREGKYGTIMDIGHALRGNWKEECRDNGSYAKALL